MLKIKKSVDLRGLKPEILVAAIVANDVYSAYHLDCVITSSLDSNHSPKSLHYKGLALDLRTKHVTSRDTLDAITETLRDSLSSQYDVVLESDHIHVEFDAKD